MTIYPVFLLYRIIRILPSIVIKVSLNYSPDSKWFAMVTSVLQTSNCHFRSPRTPHKTLPECIPKHKTFPECIPKPDCILKHKTLLDVFLNIKQIQS